MIWWAIIVNPIPNLELPAPQVVFATFHYHRRRDRNDLDSLDYTAQMSVQLITFSWVSGLITSPIQTPSHPSARGNMS